MHRTSWPVAIVAALPLLVTACGSSSADYGMTDKSVSNTSISAMKGSDGVQRVTIDTTDSFRFMPSTIRAHVGKLRILVTDHSAYPHNISVPALHATSKTVSGNPGQQTTTLVVSLPHPGSYDFVCTFHASAGMKGHIAVA
ncbi:MAG: cupredoxin domain-containing protein [Frankiales bacterium]|nr:cupredoxin domain-containing protein [Frankiales bacterium]